MPISNFVPRNMRMNVSQFFMYNLGLKNCDYNPEKQEIKEISQDSMQCCMNSIKDTTEVKKFKNEESIDINIINSIETVPKLQHNFIPYPDHNYGQQPPLTPPEEAPKVEPVVEEEADREELLPVAEKTLLEEQISVENEEEQGVTRCICGFEHDDGYMICCDNCSSWQHIECMGINSSKVPEKYSCHKCSPRELDIEGARAIQAKKKENMSEDDDDDDEETCSEDETSNKTMYTAISNTPTRITLLSNTSQQSTQGTLKNKNRRGNKPTKKKLSDQRNTRRKTKKKDKTELICNDDGENLFPDSNTLNDYISAHKLYEEIEENKYDEEFQNMHFKLPEAVPAIDFKNIVKCHHIQDVSRNRKGLVASFDIPCGNFILEYKGTLMSRKKFEDACRPIFKNCCPYVVNYNKIDHMFLVIDARDFGNDARFVRRSCTPNADLQHITSNGALHIMIISKVNILQDKEITVPFDFTLDYYKGHIECACNLEACVIRKQNEDLKQANKIINTDLIANHLKPPSPLPNESNIVKSEGQDDAVESESELNGTSEESKHEKLSREERKLQAYMKQFEKLEKKQDTGKKAKDAKTPVLKVTPDENTPVPVPAIKPTPPKKIIGGKRKINFTGKRRTRQSSGSSEPVSPTEQPDIPICATTPTTPVVSVNVNSANQLETTPHVLCRQRSRKEKEPLTLTLPIQRKVKENPTNDSSAPPPNPSAVPPVSPSKSVEQPTNLSLSVDTELESTPLKTNNLNGLLQIVQAPKTPVSSSESTSVAAPTSEEKIGDCTSRSSEAQPVPHTKPSPLTPREGKLQRRYYGSIKKHWLRQHSQSNTNSPNSQSNGFKQISLAALVASLSRQHLPSSVSPHTIVKTGGLLLKRRHLLRAMKYKEEAASCSTGHIPVGSVMNNNHNLIMRRNEPCITEENNFNDIISNVERGCTLACNTLDYVTAGNSFTPNMIMQERTTKTMENVLAGSNTRLTYSLTPSLDSQTNEKNIVNSLHTVLSDKSSQIQTMVGISTGVPTINTRDFTNSVHSGIETTMHSGIETTIHSGIETTMHSGIETTNQRLCSVVNTNSNFQSGIEVCQAAMNSTVNTNTDSYIGIQSTLLVNSVQTSLPLVSDMKTITSEMCSVIKTTSSLQPSNVPTEYTHSSSGITTTYQELLSASNPLNVEPFTQTTITEACVSLVVTQDSVTESVSDTTYLHSSNIDMESDVDNDEPTCKKQRIDVNDENSTEIGLKIVISEPSSISDISTYNSTSSCDNSIDNTSLLISSQTDYNVESLRPNSLDNVTLSNNNKYNTDSPHNNMDNNVDADSNSSISQDAGTGGKKKLSFKEYRNRRSQKAPTSNITHLSTSSEHTSQLPSMPVSPAQKINLAAGLLLTPRTVSLLNYDKTVCTYTNNLEAYVPSVSIVSTQDSIPSVMVTNGDSDPVDTTRITTSETNNLSPGQIQDEEMNVETPKVQESETLGEKGVKHTGPDVYGNNATFEPVSPGNDYDSESPVDDSVAYLNTIHTDITKNPFSIHNDITKHPFGKKPTATTQNRGSDIPEVEDDASSTHSNMSSTSYGSVSEVSHERTYPAHRSYPREHNSNSREYSTREPQREGGREYFPTSPHTTFGTQQYYQGYNSQSTQQPTTRTTTSQQRITSFPSHSNYTLSSNQTPRQRQTHRGYIPF